MDCVRYTKSFEVYYHEINHRQQVTPAALLNYLGETALSHTKAAGYGLNRLGLDNKGWVISRWLLKMEKYPKWEDRVQIETWASLFQRFYAEREFLIKDEAGNILGRATSLWIFIDITKKRPVSIPEHIKECYGTYPIKALDAPFSRLTPPEGPDIKKKEFTVRLSDIDTNDHVNNSKYVEWLMETIPTEIYNQFLPTCLEIQYKKEVCYGTKLYACGKQMDKCGTAKKYSHSIYNAYTGVQMALARTVWEPIAP